jgi:hypothetical protein
MPSQAQRDRPSARAAIPSQVTNLPREGWLGRWLQRNTANGCKVEITLRSKSDGKVTTMPGRWSAAPQPLTLGVFDQERVPQSLRFDLPPDEQEEGRRDRDQARRECQCVRLHVLQLFRSDHVPTQPRLARRRVRGSGSGPCRAGEDSEVVHAHEQRHHASRSPPGGMTTPPRRACATPGCLLRQSTAIRTGGMR